MKRNLDKPDYRSMDEVQLKHELAGLEQRILGITGDPLDYQHYRRFLDWSRKSCATKWSTTSGGWQRTIRFSLQQ